MHNNTELVAKIKKGDKDAFAELYRTYAEYALRTAIAITNSSNASADAVQETFIRVYCSIDTFDLTRPFKPWFYTILLNECKRILKSNAKLPLVSDYLDQSKEPATFDSYNFETYEDLYRAVQSLPDLNRIPLVLKYLNDFSEKEIADILEINVNTVKSRLLKGRQKLKKALEKLQKGSNQNGK